MTPAFRAPSFYEGDETETKSDDGVPAPQRTGAMNHVCFFLIPPHPKSDSSDFGNLNAHSGKPELGAGRDKQGNVTRQPCDVALPLILV